MSGWIAPWIFQQISFRSEYFLHMVAYTAGIMFLWLMINTLECDPAKGMSMLMTEYDFSGTYDLQLATFFQERMDSNTNEQFSRFARRLYSAFKSPWSKCCSEWSITSERVAARRWCYLSWERPSWNSVDSCNVSGINCKQQNWPPNHKCHYFVHYIWRNGEGKLKNVSHKEVLGRVGVGGFQVNDNFTVGALNGN